MFRKGNRKILKIFCFAITFLTFGIVSTYGQDSAKQSLNDSLITAIKEADAATVKTLIYNGADVNAKDKDGITALMYAVGTGRSNIVKVLLDNNADVNMKENAFGGTALIAAASRGYSEIVKMLLDKGADVNIGNKKGQTALMLAAARGHTGTVKILLDKNADPNAKEMELGGTALMLAAGKGYVDIANMLINRGADSDAITKEGMTALMMARENNQTHIVKLLEEVETRAMDINTKLLKLIDAGKNEKDFIADVKGLIDKGANVNTKGKDGRTALMKAVFGGYIETTKLLIDKGADVNAVEKDGYSVLMVTESMPFPDRIGIISLLIDKGANVNAKANNGWTALMEAAKGHSYLRKSLIDKGYKDVAMVPTEFIKLLIEKGADVNAKDKDGRTALLVAAENGQTETLKLLIEKEADVNASDMAGNTALMYLIMGYDSLMKRLLENKQMDSAKDFETIPIEIANILITAGADVTAKNKGGLTACLLARANKYHKLAQLLEKAGGGLLLSPIFSLKERLQFQGFSILPPQYDNWSSMDSDTKGIILRRYTGKEIHTIMAAARIEEYKDWANKSGAEFLQYAKETIEEIYKDARFKPIDIRVSSECYQGRDCVRYDFTIEDHASPQAPGSVLILTGYGFFFVHPDAKYIVDIRYSQRFPKGDKPMPVEDEVVPFFKSLEFTPIK